jgi:hypothetical protein
LRNLRTNNRTRNSTQNVAARFYAFIFISFLCGCNNFENTLSGLSVPSSDLTTTSDTSQFVLLQVIPSPSGVSSLDLIGQNLQFETYCSGSSCLCRFQYTQTNVGQVVVESPVTYQESDLIRCSNPVPAGVGSFQVRLRNSDDSARSNWISVSMTNENFGGTQQFLDLNSIESYSRIERFQCRVRHVIGRYFNSTPNLAASSDVYDPLQSEDPNLVYPFNFYSDNTAESILRIQQGADPKWDCSITGGVSGTSFPAWANPMVFSSATCAGFHPSCTNEGWLMYPNQQLSSGVLSSVATLPSATSRASFHLAKNSYSVFDRPVYAMKYPVTELGTGDPATVQSTTLRIGYAAGTVASGNTSSCPTNISLPANTRWVKLWMFRASFAPPQYVKSVPSGQSQGVCFTKDEGFYPGCEDDTGHLDAITTVTAAVSRRVILGAGGVTANACYRIDITDLAEPWARSGEDFQVPDANLPWNIGPNETISPADAAIEVAAVNGTTANPQGTDYTDYLFVVTPADVNDNDMRNGNLPEYRPQTFRKQSDCAGVDPTDPACAASFLNAIQWNIDTSGIGDSVPNQFPVCAIQRVDP